jgi:hypothetical protein
VAVEFVSEEEQRLGRMGDWDRVNCSRGMLCGWTLRGFEIEITFGVSLGRVVDLFAYYGQPIFEIYSGMLLKTLKNGLLLRKYIFPSNLLSNLED